MRTVLVAPAALVARYEGREFDGLTVGRAAYERSHVPNRRGMVAHDWTREQLDRVREILTEAGHLDQVTIRRGVPGDWRWTETGIP